MQSGSYLRIKTSDGAIESKHHMPLSLNRANVSMQLTSRASTYLSILFIIDDASRPVLDDQLGQLSWQESYLWKWFNVHICYFKILLLKFETIEIYSA